VVERRTHPTSLLAFEPKRRRISRHSDVFGIHEDVVFLLVNDDEKNVFLRRVRRTGPLRLGDR